MPLLIKSARVIDPNSPYHNKTVSIFIEDGIIKEVRSQKPEVRSQKSEVRSQKPEVRSQKPEIRSDVKVIDVPNLHISPGFFDMQVNFCDPGYEYKEDLLSGCAAAAYGGFTGVAVVPGTSPPIHTKAEVEYVKKKTSGNLVDVYPVGAISHHLHGKELAELYDMHQAGAIAFSDDKKPIMDSGLLCRALLYVKTFGGLLITHCEDEKISLNGKINEGKISARLGLKGMPALAEDVMTARDIFLCEYTGGKIHFPSVSTAKSVHLIREAKKKGLKVTAGVNAHHLALNDSSLMEFDTRYKVNPPLRSKEDIAALKKGLADGTIDVITSDHRPEDEENKKVEFDEAAFGMLGLENAFALANTSSNLQLTALIKKLAIHPREILGLPVPKIKEKEKANLTLFLPDKKWTFEEEHICSKSKNTPFTGKKMQGKVVGVVNNGKAETFL